MTRLMLESMARGYSDDRWLTFKQLQQYKAEHKDFKPTIKKGEHGVKLLRAENVSFIVDDRGKWNFLTDELVNELKDSGKGKSIQRKTVFYPYTVFNASQIAGFPPRENPAPAMSASERNALIDKFVACAGIAVEHGHERPSYDKETDTVKLPSPEKFAGTDDYYAMKLRLAFHATGHADRENREFGDGTVEVMRGETFSMLAGARLGLPMPMDGGSWPEKFEGAENRTAFEAAADSSRMLTLLEQFGRGEQPKAGWFPKQEEWPSLIAADETKPEAAPPEPAPAQRMRMR
jgi:antirestriction protein ArdC